MNDRTGRSYIIISDRNQAAFLLAKGLKVNFKPRMGGRIDFEFEDSPTLAEACEAYNTNTPIPVLNFTSAQRRLTDAILAHRQRCKARG